jgi:hypothetical protein
MKNILILLAFLSFIACQNHKPQEATQTAMPAATEAKTVKADTLQARTYSCPMHPEITGKEGDKCSKCGMALVRHN